MKDIVFATNNPHKLQEARAILAGRFNVLSLSEIGCYDEIPETSPTIEGNALQKARYVREHYTVNCFADDTGLIVDALDGAPGVMTARYAGEHCSASDNMDKLLAALGHTDRREARFLTCIALCIDGKEQTFTGVAEGSIARQGHGEGGFGYDPIFISAETDLCFAQMSADDKNRISHRGRALRLMADSDLLR